MQCEEVELGNLDSKESVNNNRDDCNVVNDETKPADDSNMRKKPKIVLIVILVMAVLVVVVGTIVLMLWSQKEGAEPIDGDVRDELKGETGEVVNAAEATDTLELKKLGIDDVLVQDLFNQFGGEVLVLGSGTDIYDLSSGAMVDDKTMLGIIMQKMNDEVGGNGSYRGLDACTVTHSYEDITIIEKGEISCFSGERVRLEAKRIFGRDIEIEPGYIRYGGDMWSYDEEADEIYLDGGLSGSGELYRALYMAEKADNRVYLYETVVMSFFPFADSDKCQQMRFSDRLDVGVDVELTPENMVQYKDVLDRYKWTFVDDGSGNYIFESVELL